MVRILTQRIFDADKNYIDAAGLSTDDKPTEGIVTGSVFREVDTGDVYMFDEVGGTWSKTGGGGGGGGGGDDAELVDIGCTYNSVTGQYTLQKTGTEILAYIEQGKVPYFDIEPSEGERLISRIQTYATAGGFHGFMFYTVGGSGELMFMAESLSSNPETPTSD